jgi:hypothetical protein
MILLSSLLPSSMSGLLLDSTLRSLLLAAVVGTGLALLRARNVVAQKAAWIMVLCGAVLMPALAPWAGRIPGLPKPLQIPVPRSSWFASPEKNPAHALTVAAAPANVRVPLSAKASAKAADARSTIDLAIEAPAADRFPAPTISSGSFITQNSKREVRPLQLSDVLILLYLAGCAALLIRLGLGIAAAIQLWLTAEPIASPDIPAGLRVRSSDALASPVTVGSGIVLPADYGEWDSEKLRIVLAHEASHVRQRDFYLQLCASFYIAMFWPSPLGWWLKRKLSDLSETISDGAAVEHAASHASYAQVLLEFAALPRPITTGVAMANHGHVISRIERLLNESSFRQAFAGGRARIAAAVLLVPIALYAATALVRVEAAQAPPSPVFAPAPASPAAVVAPAAMQAPATPAQPEIAPPPADTTGVAAPAIAPPPVTEANGAGAGTEVGRGSWSEATTQSETNADGKHQRGLSYSSTGRGYAYSYDSDGESYALISGNDNVTFSGSWFDGRKAELDKARSMAHGDFLWFTHGGKSYILDDPQIVAALKAQYAPMEELGKKQESLGKLQEELGRQQEALGRQQETASVPTPEMTKEMADVEKAVAALKAARGQEITQDKLADMQSKLADLQGKLGELQGEIGSKQGEFGEKQGELGEQQGKLGEQQGKLGEQQGRLAEQADKKVKAAIDESLKNGKARPVQ